MRILLVVITLFTGIKTISACTIFCAKDKNGQVWAANNEDGSFTFYNYINVFPKTEETKYGYFTFSYYSPKNGFGGGVEGGVNEAGLFYDFNFINRKPVKDLKNKKSFPAGDDAILTYILAHYSTTEEVVDFFEKYWFELGFTSAQMHVADKFGRFAIISASGSVLNDASYQISTNFDICGKEDGSKCWRYPIINKKLDEGIKSNKIGQSLFSEICNETAVKGKYSNYTMYSNVHNLSTGEMWFYFTSDYKHPYKITMSDLLSKGRKSYLIKDLFPKHPLTKLYKTYSEKGGEIAFKEFQSVVLDEERKKEIASIFVNAVLAENYDVSLLPFLEEHLKTNPYGHWKRSLRAILYHQKGNTKKAVSIINEYKKKVPNTSMKVEKILQLFNGQFNEDYNTVVVLHGYKDASQVFVKGLPVDFNFLIKEGNTWIGKYTLPKGVYNYQFIVDGKEVLDAKTAVARVPSSYEVDTYILSHQKAIGFTSDLYKTKIRVQVPNKDDVVFIVGQQDNLGGGAPMLKLKKYADYGREIEVELHYPATFKFVNANWTKEAIMANTEQKTKNYPLQIDDNTRNTDFQILDWKDIEN